MGIDTLRRAMSDNRSTAVLEVSGVHWASSKNVAEAVLSRRPGVIAVDANPVAQTATVTYDPAGHRWRSWPAGCGTADITVRASRFRSTSAIPWPNRTDHSS